MDKVKRKYVWLKNYADDEWIYEINSDNTARFVLGVKGENPLICFGVNSSTANPKEPDPTLLRVEKLAYKKGYDSWIMFNLYPLRKTIVKDLTFNETLRRKNIDTIKNVIAGKSFSIWAAWGDIYNKVPVYDKERKIKIRENIVLCLNEIDKIITQNSKWVALKVAECTNGLPYPIHPLYSQPGFSLYTTDFVDYSLTDKATAINNIVNSNKI